MAEQQRWEYASVSDLVDAICDGEAPWLGDLSDNQYGLLLDRYRAEQAMVHAGVEAAEAHANAAVGPERRSSPDVDRGGPGSPPAAHSHEEDDSGS
jgi:hypothetical protein